MEKKKFRLIFFLFLFISCSSKNQSNFTNRIITKEDYIKEYKDFDRVLNTIKELSNSERSLESFEYEIQESLLCGRSYLISILLVDNDSCVLSTYLITYQYDYYHNFIKEEVFYLNQPPTKENAKITPIKIDNN